MKNLIIIFITILALSAGIAIGSVHTNCSEITAESYLTDTEADNLWYSAQDYQVKCDTSGYTLWYHGQFVNRFSWNGSRELDSLILIDNL